MIVCDECKNITAKGFDCAIELYKTEANKRKRQIIKIPLVLCDNCISKVCKNLGHMKAIGILSGA